MNSIAPTAMQTNQFLSMMPPSTSGTSASGTNASADPNKAAEEFEATYLSTVFDRMFSSIKTDGPFGGGNAEATWRSFLATEYANEVSANGGIGIADSVKAELVRLQEITHK